MELLPQRQLKSYSADVNFKVCLEQTCEHEIGNSDKVLSVEYDVNQLAGWTTHQRNAGHSGYIPITLDVNDFSESWTWGARPNAINPVAVQDGKVIVTDEAYHEDASIFMLDEATGDQVWKIDLEAVPALNPPAISEGKVWAATTGHSDTYLHAFDFETGQKLHSSEFSGQWPHFFAPTPYANSIYQGGGYYGGYVHSFSADDGHEEWEVGLSGAWDMYTPAVSGSYALHYNGQDLHAVHRGTGELVFTLGDTLNEYASHAYHGSPVVYENFALAYAGGAFSGTASASAEHRDERHLVMFDIKNKLHLWNSTERYLTHPAVNDDVVYVGSNSRGKLDAIDVNTGEVLWSWEPSDEAENEMHRNVIVTDNLLFMSTNSKVHAIDLSTKQSIWNYPMPGMIAISENQTLLIATGARGSDGKLVAIKLK
jgi:outer membrane protein assembly factor BamB